MSNVYCQYCGTSRSSISSLTSSSCRNNPNGSHHAPYEGDEKSKYECKYCGTSRSSILSLTSSSCSKNTDGKHHMPFK